MTLSLVISETGSSAVFVGLVELREPVERSAFLTELLVSFTGEVGSTCETCGIDITEVIVDFFYCMMKTKSYL